MEPSSKRRAVVFVVLGAVALLFVLVQSGLLILLGNIFPIEGDVVSISAPNANEREALVKLNWGPVVRASVPAACLVFPGQVATVNFTGPAIGSSPGFRVWESREKQ